MKFQIDSQLSTRYQQFKPQGQTCENVLFFEFSNRMKIVDRNEGTQIHRINSMKQGVLYCPKLKKRRSQAAALFQIQPGWFIQPASPDWWMFYKSLRNLIREQAIKSL